VELAIIPGRKAEDEHTSVAGLSLLFRRLRGPIKQAQVRIQFGGGLLGVARRHTKMVQTPNVELKELTAQQADPAA
jgi:hypothetical protein